MERCASEQEKVGRPFGRPTEESTVSWLEDEMNLEPQLARRLEDGRQAVTVGKGHGRAGLYW